MEPVDTFQHPDITLDIREVIKLLTKINPQGVTFEDLQKFPQRLLSNHEITLVNYFLKNQALFNTFSILDRHPESLSPEDLYLVSRLLGNAMVLNAEDLEYLRSLTQTEEPLLQSKPEKTDQQPTGNIPKIDLQHTLEKDVFIKETKNAGRPEPSRISAPNKLSGSPQNPFLLTKSSLNNAPFRDKENFSVVSEINDWFHRPEVLRVLSSLIWNPHIYEEMPLLFFREKPVKPFSDELSQPIEGIAESEFGPHKKQRAIPPLQRVQLSASKLMDLCQKINPSGTVSLKELRSYKPLDEEETKILNCLNQLKIFEILSSLDGESGTISLEDINIAAHEGALILTDPHVALILVP
jgi:hypothetical protein